MIRVFVPKDVEKAIPFYRDTLGITARVVDKHWAELEVEGFTLALHQADELPAEHSSSPTVVFNTDDVRATHAALKAAGLQVGKLHQVCSHDGQVGISGDFKDPDGNHLSVFGFVPEKEWKN